jgi:hypothetical protein
MAQAEQLVCEAAANEACYAGDEDISHLGSSGGV